MLIWCYLKTWIKFNIEFSVTLCVSLMNSSVSSSTYSNPISSITEKFNKNISKLFFFCRLRFVSANHSHNVFHWFPLTGFHRITRTVLLKVKQELPNAKHNDGNLFNFPDQQTERLLFFAPSLLSSKHNISPALVHTKAVSNLIYAKWWKRCYFHLCDPQPKITIKRVAVALRKCFCAKDNLRLRWELLNQSAEPHCCCQNVRFFCAKQSENVASGFVWNIFAWARGLVGPC